MQAGIVRDGSAEELYRIRGSVRDEYTLARSVCGSCRKSPATPPRCAR
ncbi:MAG: hypothetical protein M3R43_00715 [Acidobacteriota bacterium]|nr:hypothetical protein [Acidobacteriota bacterium]